MENAPFQTKYNAIKISLIMLKLYKNICLKKSRKGERCLILKLVKKKVLQRGKNNKKIYYRSLRANTESLNTGDRI